VLGCIIKRCRAVTAIQSADAVAGMAEVGHERPRVSILPVIGKRPISPGRFDDLHRFYTNGATLREVDAPTFELLDCDAIADAEINATSRS